MVENLDLIVRGGIVVSEGESYKADVGIKDGVITALGKIDAESTLKDTRVIDASGKYVLPGIIDCHVHFRQPGFEYKEDWVTGSLAAAFGGVTTVIEMPSMHPANRLGRTISAEKRACAELMLR